MHTVLVLSGGSSPERNVSLRSGEAVKAALIEAGHRVYNLDPATELDVLADMAHKVDIVFPVLHGEGGEDGTIQQKLEDLQVRFVGSGSTASRLCFDKHLYKQRLAEHGFPVPSGTIVDTASYAVHELTKAPYVLKPFDGGSSIDTFIVRSPDTADRNAITDAFRRHPKMLLEQLISGTEITVSVLDTTALPVIEIVPPDNQEFDYDNKYNGASQELCPPISISPAIQQHAQKLASDIHVMIGCAGLTRTDMIIDDDGNPWVLETNTIPGMTDQSLFPKAARQAGITMPELVSLLVEISLK